MHWRRKWQPTPVFLPGESQEWGSLVGCCLWVAQSRTQLKRLGSSSSRMNSEAWHAVVHGVAKSQTQLSDWTELNWTRRLSLFFFFNILFYFNFTILYWFCHISKWIRHRYTYVPHPEPSSLLPPHTIPLGHPSAPAPRGKGHSEK